jgi:hypothetical protein
MSNMSYCRFENTARDLSDCFNEVEKAISKDASFHEFVNMLSEYERDAFRQMIDTCKDFVETVEKWKDDKNG